MILPPLTSKNKLNPTGSVINGSSYGGGVLQPLTATKQWQQSQQQQPTQQVFQQPAPAVAPQNIFQKAASKVSSVLENIFGNKNNTLDNGYKLDFTQPTTLGVGQNSPVITPLMTATPKQDKIFRTVAKPVANELNRLETKSTTLEKQDWRDRVYQLAKNPQKDTPFVGDAVAIPELAKLFMASEKLRKGEASAEDAQILQEWLDQQNRDKTFGYKVADGLILSAKFMGEMYLSGGTYTIGKESAKKGMKFLMSKAGKKATKAALKKFAPKVIAGVAGETVRTVATAPLKVTKGTLENQITSNLEVINGVTNTKETLPKSMTKAFLSSWVDNLSERGGDAFTKVFSKVSIPIKTKLVKNAVYNTFKKLVPDKITKISKVLTKAGYDGIVNEWLEERVGDVTKGVLHELGLSNEEFSIKNIKDNFWVELITISVPGVLNYGSNFVDSKFGKLGGNEKDKIDGGDQSNPPPNDGFIPPGEYTPNEIRGKIINTPLQDTTEGKTIIRASLVAEENGQNITITAPQSTQMQEGLTTEKLTISPEIKSVTDTIDALNEEILNVEEEERDDDKIQELEDKLDQIAKKIGLGYGYDDAFDAYTLNIFNPSADIKESAQKMKTVAAQFDIDIEVNEDGTLKLYHGTSKKNAESILKNGLDGGSYLSSDTGSDVGGVNGAGYYGKVVLAVDVDPRQLDFNPAGEFKYISSEPITRVKIDEGSKVDRKMTKEEMLEWGKKENENKTQPKTKTETKPLNEKGLPITTQKDVDEIQDIVNKKNKGGKITLQVKDGKVYLHWLTVDFKKRGKGLATKIMQNLVGELNTRNLASTLLVDGSEDQGHDYKRLIPFYEKFGYKATKNGYSRSWTMERDALFKPKNPDISQDHYDFAISQYENVKKAYLKEPKFTSYNEKGELVHVNLNTDDFRLWTIKKGYRGFNAGKTHEIASMWNNGLTDEMIPFLVGKGNKAVLILAGGAGSGKGTAIEIAAPKYFDQKKYPIVIDQVSSNQNKLVAKIKKIRDYNYFIDYVFVDRPPELAFEGVVRRAIGLWKKGELPRTVHINRVIEDNLTARDVAIENFKNTVTDGVWLLSNVGSKEEAEFTLNKAEAIDMLKEKSYNQEELVSSLKEKYDKILREEKIPDEIRESLIGEIKNDVEDGGQPKVQPIEESNRQQRKTNTKPKESVPRTKKENVLTVEKAEQIKELAVGKAEVAKEQRSILREETISLAKRITGSKSFQEHDIEFVRENINQERNQEITDLVEDVRNSTGQDMTETEAIEYAANVPNKSETVVKLPEEYKTFVKKRKLAKLSQDNKILKSRVFERLRQEYDLEGDAEIKAISLEKDIDRAVRLIEKNKQRAFNIAMGFETSDRVTSTSVNISMFEKAMEEGNLELASRLVRNRSLSLTRKGQEIIAEKSSIKDNSTSKYVKELVSARLDKLGKNYLSDLTNLKEKVSNKEKAVKLIDKKVSDLETKIKNKKLSVNDALLLLDKLKCI